MVFRRVGEGMSLATLASKMWLLVELVGTTKSWNIALYRGLIYVVEWRWIDSVVDAALGIGQVSRARFANRFNEVCRALRYDDLPIKYIYIGNYRILDLIVYREQL